MTNRPLKFRAWHKKLKLLSVPFEPFYPYPYELVFENAPFEKTYKGNHEFNYLELMQYTGLKDENGIEIFEGDILAPKWIVSFDSSHACFVLKDDSIGFKDLYVPFNAIDQVVNGEVIGNIYENGDLLK